MRLVRDGGAGETTSEQFCYLTFAMDQCDSMLQTIDDMVQWERLRTGITCVDRQWVLISEIRNSIEETVRPWALLRNVDVRWDIKLDAKTKV